MPELPEIEVLRRSLVSDLLGKCLSDVQVNDIRLRWPVDGGALRSIISAKVIGLRRRSKYLLIDFSSAQVVMIHLGMSGQLFWSKDLGGQNHRHVIFSFGKRHLVYRDPRRFGSVHVFENCDEAEHPRLIGLGVEPLSHRNLGQLLFERSRKRRCAVKTFVMDAKHVVGVGNIYANEALFRAGIHPSREAGRISIQRYRRLAESLVSCLEEAISAGGTTLRDYQNAHQEPGRNAQQLKVYGRLGLCCVACHSAILHVAVAQRATYYCPKCQR